MSEISGSSSHQRRAHRARVHFPARYVSSNLHAEGHVTDVSTEGLFFCSDFLDDAGERARLWLDLPTGALELCGEVRWVNEAPDAGGMGIQLVELSHEDRAVLAGLAGAA